MASVLSSHSLFSTSVPKVREAKGDQNTQVLSSYCEVLGTLTHDLAETHHNLPFIAPVLQMNKLRLREVVPQSRSHPC